MTTNKPEVLYATNLYNSAPVACLMRRTGDKVEPVIRLSDYEAARASDKARIAELESALSECAASPAWNCFGECRAVHDGPIMPAQMALEHSRAALVVDIPKAPSKKLVGGDFLCGWASCVEEISEAIESTGVRVRT